MKGALKTIIEVFAWVSYIAALINNRLTGSALLKTYQVGLSPDSQPPPNDAHLHDYAESRHVTQGDEKLCGRHQKLVKSNVKVRLKKKAIAER